MGLTWNETFNAPGGPPDPAKWTCCVNAEGGGNQELQYYTPEQVTCSPAGLVITAARDNGSYAAWNGPSQYLSGKVWTKGKFEWRYGHLDVVASIPAGLPGAWPAIWLLGANLDENTWPGCGEIDVMENFGAHAAPATICGALHTPKDNPATDCIVPGAPLTSMHTYSLDWRPTSLTWLVDGKPFQRILEKTASSGCSTCPCS